MVYLFCGNKTGVARLGHMYVYVYIYYVYVYAYTHAHTHSYIWPIAIWMHEWISHCHNTITIIIAETCILKVSQN